MQGFDDFFLLDMFTSKSIKIFSQHYYELMWKIEEPEGKKNLVVDGYMLVKVLDKEIKIQ